MLRSFTGWSLIVALTAALVAMPATANAQQGNSNTNRLIVPITGVVAGVGAVAGNLAISRFAIQDGALVAIGALTATVTDAAGNVVTTLVTQVTVPVTNATAAGSCDVLNLVLGPLHLELLGLVIDLNQVVLNITAQTGAGNLLGNLLCTITGLLDAGSLGGRLVGALNQLIGVLGAL